MRFINKLCISRSCIIKYFQRLFGDMGVGEVDCSLHSKFKDEAYFYAYGIT